MPSGRNACDGMWRAWLDCGCKLSRRCARPAAPWRRARHRHMRGARSAPLPGCCGFLCSTAEASAPALQRRRQDAARLRESTRAERSDSKVARLVVVREVAWRERRGCRQIPGTGCCDFRPRRAVRWRRCRPARVASAPLPTGGRRRTEACQDFARTRQILVIPQRLRVRECFAPVRHGKRRASCLRIAEGEDGLVVLEVVEIDDAANERGLGGAVLVTSETRGARAARDDCAQGSRGCCSDPDRHDRTTCGLAQWSFPGITGTSNHLSRTCIRDSARVDDELAVHQDVRDALRRTAPGSSKVADVADSVRIEDGESAFMPGLMHAAIA